MPFCDDAKGILTEAGEGGGDAPNRCHDASCRRGSVDETEACFVVRDAGGQGPRTALDVICAIAGIALTLSRCQP